MRPRFGITTAKADGENLIGVRVDLWLLDAAITLHPFGDGLWFQRIARGPVSYGTGDNGRLIGWKWQRWYCAPFFAVYIAWRLGGYYQPLGQRRGEQ